MGQIMTKKYLLIVDDEEDILSLLEDLFEDKVDKVYTVTSAKEGVLIFKNKNINCILSDLKMPGIDGMGFIKRIRNMDKKVPFIFLSGFGSIQAQAKALKYGAYEFIDKSEFDQIAKVVDKAYEAVEKNNAAGKEEKSVEDEEKSLDDLKDLLQEKKSA